MGDEYSSSGLAYVKSALRILLYKLLLNAWNNMLLMLDALKHIREIDF